MLDQARSQGFNVAFSPGNNLNPITEMLRDIGEQVNEVPIKKHLRWLAERCEDKWILGVDDMDKLSPKMVDAYCRLLRKLAPMRESILLLYSCRTKGRSGTVDVGSRIRHAFGSHPAPSRVNSLR